MLAAIVGLAASTAMLLYYGDFHPGQNEYTEGYGGPVMDQWNMACFEMFIFVTSVSNWHMVMQGYLHTKTAAVFFLPLAVLGVFFLMSIIIATFEASYSERSAELEFFARETKFTGTTLTFVMWYWDGSEKEIEVAEDDFAAFLVAHWQFAGRQDSRLSDPESTERTFSSETAMAKLIFATKNSSRS
jgi:hypothetical protein